MTFSSKLKAVVFAAAVPAALFVTVSASAQGVQMSRGEYVARLANCIACHSTPDGAPFAGGLKMNVPMLGNIYTTNITPDKETGIGNYSYEDFEKAMRDGVAKDGHHLYPAMPYPSYAKMSDDDIHALYDFFMNEVKPVNQANKPDEITGWRNVRWALGIWNTLFLDSGAYKEKSGKDAAWNRGAYLVQGAGHCGACHTPRGLFFQEKGLDESESAFLSGAPLDNWSSPSLNGDINSGLGRWSEQDIVDFLKNGRNPHGTAFGTMVEVVNNSTSYMTDEDLKAMAVYLKSLPPEKEKGATAYAYDNGTTEQLSQLKFDGPGAVTYYQYCVSCHLYDGKGQGLYHPGLAGNPVVLDQDPSSLINLTLNGSLRVISSGKPHAYGMPFFRLLRNDEQIADVLTFIRKGWGNNAPAVTPEQVAKIRADTDPTRNDIVVLKMK